MKTNRGHSLVRVGCLAALIHFIVACVSHAEVTIYAKFADGLGSWAGGVNRPELPVPQQPGWVRLDSFAIKFETPATINPGSGGGAGAVEFRSATLTKIVDRLTPTIFGNLAAGQFLRADGNPAIAPLTVEFVKQDVAGPVVVMRIELKLVFFTTQGPTSSSGDDEVREEIAMAYGSVRMTTWPINPNGTQGTPVIRSWDRVTGTPNFP